MVDQQYLVNNFESRLIIQDGPIPQAKMLNIHRIQLLKYNNFHCKLITLGFKTVGRIKQEN